MDFGSARSCAAMAAGGPHSLHRKGFIFARRPIGASAYIHRHDMGTRAGNGRAAARARHESTAPRRRVGRQERTIWKPQGT